MSPPRTTTFGYVASVANHTGVKQTAPVRPLLPPIAVAFAVVLFAVGGSPAQGKAPSGALTQPAGAAGCVLTSGREGCGPARGIAGAQSLAISSDGRNVYASGSAGPRSTGSLGAFARDERTGALTQLEGAEGCFSEDGSDGCTALPALKLVQHVAVSGDGRNVYAVGQRVVTFARDPGTGALTPL